MLLNHCSCQGGESDTLELLFENGGFDEEMTSASVSVIRRLREDQSDRRVWGLISMGSIVLLAENVYHSNRYVQFYALSNESYTISYSLPESSQPWHSISAETNCEETAVAMILKVMDLSAGWSADREPPTEDPADLPWPPEPCWEMPESAAEILELLQEVELPNGVQSSIGEYDVVRLSQGPPTFLTIHSMEIRCWVPPEESPWPDSTYEGSFRSKEQALALIRSAAQKWPRGTRTPAAGEPL